MNVIYLDKLAGVWASTEGLKLGVPVVGALNFWLFGALASCRVGIKPGGRDASAPGLTLLDYDGLYLTLALKLLCSVGKKWYMVTSTRHAKIDLGIH